MANEDLLDISIRIEEDGTITIKGLPVKDIIKDLEEKVINVKVPRSYISRDPLEDQPPEGVPQDTNIVLCNLINCPSK